MHALPVVYSQVEVKYNNGYGNSLLSEEIKQTALERHLQPDFRYAVNQTPCLIQHSGLHVAWLLPCEELGLSRRAESPPSLEALAAKPLLTASRF